MSGGKRLRLLSHLNQYQYARRRGRDSQSEERRRRSDLPRRSKLRIDDDTTDEQPLVRDIRLDVRDPELARERVLERDGRASKVVGDARRGEDGDVGEVDELLGETVERGVEREGHEGLSERFDSRTAVDCGRQVISTVSGRKGDDGAHIQ